MMRMMSIASGSSGNCIYIGSDTTHILVDAGTTKKRIEEGLKDLGLTGEDLSAILVTHEHSDHISGLGVMHRGYPTPIFSTGGTLEQVGRCKTLGRLSREVFREINEDEAFQIGDLEILPFRISHDAAQPVGYRINCGDKSVAVVTDLGHYNHYLVERLQGLHAVLIESNHDVHMLQAGPYPYPLKRRIMGERGHLSNESCGQFLGEILHDHLNHIVLGHLSKENNMEELAYETVRLEITMGDNPYQASDFPITVARRDQCSEILYV